jgi:hypothetical protein
MTAQVEIYTTPTCGYCRMAKQLLARKNVSYTELDVSVDPALRAGDDPARRRADHRSADFHRQAPCRRLRRSLCELNDAKAGWTCSCWPDSLLAVQRNLHRGHGADAHRDLAAEQSRKGISH